MNNQYYISEAKRSASIQINELKKIKKIFNKSFIKAVDLILNCKGKIIFAGIGKSGLIARKISATLASTGTPSFFLHPAEAIHGDLGMLKKEDVVVLISYSGETEEIIKLLPSLKKLNVSTVLFDIIIILL